MFFMDIMYSNPGFFNLSLVFDVHKYLAISVHSGKQPYKGSTHVEKHQQCSSLNIQQQQQQQYVL